MHREQEERRTQRQNSRSAGYWAAVKTGREGGVGVRIWSKAEVGRYPQMGEPLVLIGSWAHVEYGKGEETGQGTSVIRLRKELLGPPIMGEKRRRVVEVGR